MTIKHFLIMVAAISQLYGQSAQAIDIEYPLLNPMETMLVRVNGSVTYASNLHYRGIDLSQEDNVIEYSISVDQAQLGRMALWSTEINTPLFPTQSRYSSFSYSKDFKLTQDIILGLGGSRYHLNSDTGEDINYTEWNINVFYQHQFSWSISFSDSPYGLEASAWITQVEFTHPLSARLDFRAGAIYSYLENALAIPLNYANYDVSLDYALKNVLITTSYHRTTSSAKTLYGIHADNRFGIAISVGF